MNVSEAILKEADILLKAFATGVILIFVYDLLRIIRRLIPHGTVWIAVEDFLFWAGSALTIFAMLYRENDGYLRGFSIGGVVLGMLLYSLLLSRFVVKGSVFILEKVLYVLLRPLIRLGRLFFRPVRACGKQSRKAGRFLKKRLKKFWKTVKIGLCKQ